MRRSAGPARPARAKAPPTPDEVRDAVLDLVRSAPGLTDEQIARRLKITTARAGTAARALAKRGLVERLLGETGATENHPVRPTPQRRASRSEATALTDAQVLDAVTVWLAGRGFEIEQATGSHLLARRGDATLACHALAGGTHLPLARNALILGLERLVDLHGRGHTIYALAFPDLSAFNASFARLAAGMRKTLNLHALFVRAGASGAEVRAIDHRGKPVTLL